MTDTITLELDGAKELHALASAINSRMNAIVSSTSSREMMEYLTLYQIYVRITPSVQYIEEQKKSGIIDGWLL
jgi:hypothetical protein